MVQQKSDAERYILKRYLSQYYRAKQRKRILEDRLNEIRAEIQHPSIRSSSSNGLPTGRRISSGAAALTFREAEIEDRIQQQREHEATAILNIMDILDFLPPDSMEKNILELRHIDCLSWNAIIRSVHLTRSPCNEYYNRGLEKLLTFKKVHSILADFEDRINRIENDGY